MADQLYYDFQQALGYLQTIAENTRRMADALEALTQAQPEETGDDGANPPKETTSEKGIANDGRG